MQKLQEIISYAVQKHYGQFRKGSEDQKHLSIPYITHPLEVMKCLTLMDVKDEDVLVAAVGHDLIEDCDVSEAEIELMFGEDVLTYILECTRLDSEGTTWDSKVKFLESFKHKSKESVLIKIVDRYCNVLDYTRTKGKLKYASKYAKQAEPLFKIFEHSIEDYKSICDVDKIQSLIKFLRSI